jgi:hypothetical protein
LKLKRNLIGVVLCILLVSCTQSVGNPYADATNNLIQKKQEAIVLFQGISDGCKQGLIPTDSCAKAKDLYQKVQEAYKIAEDALILSVQTGDSQRAQETAIALNNLVADIAKLKGMK